MYDDPWRGLGGTGHRVDYLCWCSINTVNRVIQRPLSEVRGEGLDPETWAGYSVCLMRNCGGWGEHFRMGSTSFSTSMQCALIEMSRIRSSKAQPTLCFMQDSRWMWYMIPWDARLSRHVGKLWDVGRGWCGGMGSRFQPLTRTLSRDAVHLEAGRQLRLRLSAHITITGGIENSRNNMRIIRSSFGCCT